MSLKEATEYLISQYPQETFLNRESCPKCKVSWKALCEDIETEPIGSEALDQAICIVMNCQICRIKFKRQLDVIKKIYDDRIGVIIKVRIK